MSQSPSPTHPDPESHPRSPAVVHALLLNACATMEVRLRGLLDEKGKVADETHALRKLGKSLRGGMVLFEVSRPAVRAISAVGRLLGAPRDSISRRTTWRRLGLIEGPHAAESSVAAITALLNLHAKAATRRPPEETVAWAEIRLRHANAALTAIPPEELDRRMADGRRHLAKRLRKRLKAVRKHLGADELHELRKAIKAWLGALHHLDEEPAKELVDCADLLGDVNDLHTLGTWLAAHGFTPALAPLPWRALEERLAGKLEEILEGAPGVRRALSAG